MRDDEGVTYDYSPFLSLTQKDQDSVIAFLKNSVKVGGGLPRSAFERWRRRRAGHSKQWTYVILLLNIASVAWSVHQVQIYRHPSYRRIGRSAQILDPTEFDH